ncbi:MAG TPA: sulfate reduction electron transfer complex DsrMKJOP subunit DsrM [Acidobacteriota bacterium]|nr:sulfate reduction electron transfer complex DsrMKJOP subunit DsrM [Acidobacteriota bacterium]
MNVLASFCIVIVLALLAIVGVQLGGLYLLFGAVLPYVAIALFLGGLTYRVVSWARAPVPFRIPTTCGQQKSLPWIKSSRLDNPHDGVGVLGRMALEVLLFRSLFRNSRTELKEGSNKVVFGPDKWLWFGALLFHYSFLVIFVRHMRFFSEPVPSLTLLLQGLDGFFQVGVPVVYMTSFMFLAAVAYLFARRIISPMVRYISLPADYFPLFLLLGIGTTGVLLRHIVKTDVVGVKELGMGLLSFSPVASQDLHYLFYVHLFLVTVLIAYFPFSKLVHMAGVFLSPTRNLANNNRKRRHVNPWDYAVKTHTYQEYEEEFRDKMIKAGIPVEKE